MIEMNRLNGEKVWLNPDQIKMIFSSPDTTLVFMDGSSLTVKDSVSEIQTRWMSFRHAIQTVPSFSNTQEEKQP